MRFLRLHIDNLEGDTECVTFADGSEPFGEGGSSTLDIQVHRQRCGAVVKMDLLPLAVVVGGVAFIGVATWFRNGTATNPRPLGPSAHRHQCGGRQMAFIDE